MLYKFLCTYLNALSIIWLDFTYAWTACPWMWQVLPLSVSIISLTICIQQRSKEPLSLRHSLLWVFFPHFIAFLRTVGSLLEVTHWKKKNRMAVSCQWEYLILYFSKCLEKNIKWGLLISHHFVHNEQPIGLNIKHGFRGVGFLFFWILWKHLCLFWLAN